MAGGIDGPYILAKHACSDVSLDWQVWPNVEYRDIYNYLITTTSL